MNEIQRILLAAHDSLVGEVFPSLSAVDIVYGQSFVKFLFFLSTRPTEDDLECMSVIETEMLAHFVDLDVSSEFILGLPPEKRGEICIFQRRKESEKSQPELTTAEAELKDPLERFIRILDACWHDVVGDSTGIVRDDLLNDWLQFHWEFIVESAVSDDYSIVLEPYGEGAETASLRIYDLQRPFTHRICCRPKEGNGLRNLIDQTWFDFPESGLQLDEFVSCTLGEWYRIEPPFNAVHLHLPDSTEPCPHSDTPWVFSISEVSFFLQPV